jgi:diguanylate cyclase
MPDFATPSDIARETLRRLALKRTPPTPDNYLALYHEVAGTSVAEIFPERALKTLSAELPKATPQQLRFTRQLDAAIGEQSWSAIKTALLGLTSTAGAEAPQWSGLIRDLVLQLERSHANLTPAQKRESLEHVLKSSVAPDRLFARLQSLLRSWAQGRTDDGIPLVDGEITAPGGTSRAIPETAASLRTAASGTTPTHTAGELQELLAQFFETTIGMLVSGNAELAKEAAEVAADARAATTAAGVARLTARIKKFNYRLQFATEDEGEVKAGLLHLVRLIIENIGELVVDDNWLHGQVTVLVELCQQPLNLRRLDDVERRLKDVIYKQGTLKKHLSAAQDRLKAMLATFVDRLGDFSETTTGYHETIERCATKISQASDISQLSDVLDEVMRETRTVQFNTQRTREELQDMRRRVDEAETEVDRLQVELQEASEMVRVDTLTGALNRKGLDEAMTREVARCRRSNRPLSIGLLDLDDFKRLNDSLGHQVGDQALVHLATLVRETLRPQDTVARFGGEEFVILLPDTELDAALQACARLQRELTRKFFMHQNEKVLITFSAGIAELGPEEAAADALKRADSAMYVAKRAGKNRVMAA